MSDTYEPYRPPPGQPPPMRPSQQARAGSQTSVAAIAAIFLGFFGLVVWIFAAIPAIILSAIAKSDIRANPATLRGNALANTGLVLGILGLFSPFYYLVFFSALLAVTQAGYEEPLGDRIAHIHLSGPLLETPGENAQAIFYQPYESLKDLVDRIGWAGEDDSVKALLFTTDAPSLGMGQLEELWQAIETFKKSGKSVYAHTTALQTGSYALLSGATHLNVVPTDTIWLAGLSMHEIFLKDALEKLGLKADIVKMGQYKSAGEMLSETGPSEAARANTNWLLDGLYEGLVNIIAQSRGETPERVMEIIDRGPYTVSRALEAGLIDSSMHLDEFLDEIREEYGEDIYIDNYYGYDYTSSAGGIADLFTGSSATRDWLAEDSIVVIYVEGTIAQGFSDSSPFGGASGALSGDISNLLRWAEEDDSVKAVVMRVDSPGGSAVASEEILRAAERVRAKKPLIVSMGSVAASGGYYIACKADSIFADAMTITASIGVIGGKLITSGMWDELGINWAAYKRGAHADILDGDHPFTDEERRWILEYMEETYRVFTGHVVEGRGDLLTKDIDEIAGGRVYTGKQARELGLIDHIGGLVDAIEYAAGEAGLDDYDVRVLPEPTSFYQALVESFMGTGGNSSDLYFDTRAPRLRATPLLDRFQKRPAPLAPAAALLELLDPARARVATDALAAMDLIRREGVVVIMPEMYVVQ